MRWVVLAGVPRAHLGGVPSHLGVVNEGTALLCGGDLDCHGAAQDF